VKLELLAQEDYPVLMGRKANEEEKALKDLVD